MLLEQIAFLYEFLFFQKLSLVIAFIGLIFTLTIAAMFSRYTHNNSLFFSFLSISLGVVLFIFMANDIAIFEAVPFFAALLIAVGATLLLCFIFVSISSRKKRLKEEREKQVREMRYTLPQKDNTFIRARLNVVSEDMGEKSDGEEIKLRFTYAKSLLEKLRLQTLTMTERLEMDELANVFAVYAKKETYAVEDVRLISEAFARVLKLSAKYAV